MATIFGLLVVTLALFLHGRWRYDVVALFELVAAGVLGLVPPDGLFTGFGHPAMITVAAVFVISYALLNAGLVDLLAGGHPNSPTCGHPKLPHLELS